MTRAICARKSIFTTDLSEKWPESEYPYVLACETGASNPELEHILSMCRLFGVSADALLRDDVAVDGRLILPDNPKHPWLSMDDSYAYIADQQIIVRRLALGVALCVLSPAPVAALSGNGLWGEVLGAPALLLMVAWAVYLFITTSVASKKYLHIKRGRFTPVPGVVQWVNASLEHL